MEEPSYSRSWRTGNETKGELVLNASLLIATDGSLLDDACGNEPLPSWADTGKPEPAWRNTSKQQTLTQPPNHHRIQPSIIQWKYPNITLSDYPTCNIQLSNLLPPSSQSVKTKFPLPYQKTTRPSKKSTNIADVQQSAIKYYHSSISVNKPVPACFVSRQCWSCTGREPERSHTDRRPRPHSPGRIVSNAPALSGTAAGERQHCRR